MLSIRRGKETFSSPASKEKSWVSHNLDFEHYERINLCCFKPLDLNSVVTLSAIGHVTIIPDASGTYPPPHSQQCLHTLLTSSGSESIPAKKPSLELLPYPRTVPVSQLFSGRAVKTME